MRRNGMALLTAMTSIISAAASVSTGANDVEQPALAGGPTVLVPAYFYPEGDRLRDWNRLTEAARSTRLEVILNPASGPGAERDPNYVAVVEALHRAGGRILAYVDSNYSDRPIADVERDLHAYLRFYRVDGFFIDQMANTPEALGYYRSVRKLIHGIAPELKVVGNPGTPHTTAGYLETVDTLVTFEGSAKAYAAYDPQKDAPWLAGCPSSRIANIVYDVGTAAAGRETLARAKRTRAGSVYITDQRMPNPYLRLPRYWADELGALRTMNETSQPPATPKAVPSARPGAD
jgi:hypothetical protein